MLPVFWCLVVASSVCPGHAHFNLVAQKKFKSDLPLGVGANFGFSLAAFRKGSESALIVGAPLADQIGNVFACDPNRNTCSGVNTAGIEKYTKDENYNNQSYWYGATVSGNDNFFVACAPMFIDKDKREGRINGGQSGTFGRCYQYRDPIHKPELLKSYTYSTKEKHFELTMDSLGWCSAIESDESILIGGPAMVSGRVLKTKNNNVAITVGEASLTNFNFGYSVASGKFIRKDSESIAVGSPYGSDGHGKVSFRRSNNIGIGLGELRGLQVGSMYGAVLCAARITHRAKDDLLVGAPTFADHGGEIYNVGAVYVYIASPKNVIPVLRVTISGKGTNSYFGAAILNVGDLNGDKFDDIVIAAPYEDSTGVVYLYSGGHLGTNISPLQVIRPESSIRSFGYSLAIVRDFDENGCNELAIGAPQSNEVVLLRCVAAITVKLSKLPVQIKGNNGKDEIKRFELCLNAEFPDKPTTVNATIRVQISIQHNGVTLQKPTDGIEIFKIQDKQDVFCKNIEMLMIGTGDYNKKIFYTLKASLLDDPTGWKDFKPSDVKLNEQSVLLLNGSIWAQECGERLCQPKLDMRVDYVPDESTYVIGSSPSINVLISVENSGDVAYDACVHVAVTGAVIGDAPSNCRMDNLNKLLVCRPSSHLLRKGDPWDQQGIYIDTTALTSSNSEILVNLTLFNECGLNIAKNMTKKISLKASTVDIFVQGRTDVGVDNTVNMTRKEIAKQKQFHHIYTISNRGFTNWVDVPISVDVQNLDVVTSTVYLKNKQCKAGVVSASADFVTHDCVAEALSTHTAVEVNVILTVVPDKLDGVIGKENITVQSNITVKLHSHVESAQVTSILKLIEAVVPIWIIIVASIMGLLILLIIFLILRQCGFLERKNKEELKRVRQSVRRQTMIRQTLLKRVTIRSEDQEQLVNEATASFEDAKKKKDRRVVIQD